MARNLSRLKLGYYPLVENEAKRIRQFLQFPAACAVLDPCAGTGRALALFAGDTGARLYGIELDAFRAAEAGKTLDQRFACARKTLVAKQENSFFVSSTSICPERVYLKGGGGVRRCPPRKAANDSYDETFVCGELSLQGVPNLSIAL